MYVCIYNIFEYTFQNIHTRYRNPWATNTVINGVFLISDPCNMTKKEEHWKTSVEKRFISSCIRTSNCPYRIQGQPARGCLSQPILCRAAVDFFKQMTMRRKKENLSIMFWLYPSQLQAYKLFPMYLPYT